MKQHSALFSALRAAFPHTLPVMAGFLFLGLAYGIYMNTSGFSFFYPLFMSIAIFGGSLEFVAVSMLLSAYAPLQTAMLALMVQLRHLFYGLSMLEKYHGMGVKKWYLIYGLCDETFSINYTAEVPKDVDKGWFYFFVTLCNQAYWVTGATVGGLIGSLLPFPTDGLDFVMTAMFVVIFLDQWQKEPQHISAVLGIGVSAGCLLLFGADTFLLPTMACLLVALLLLRKPLERRLPR